MLPPLAPSHSPRPAGRPRGPERRTRREIWAGRERRRGPRRHADLPGASPHLGRWIAVTAALALGAAAGLWSTSFWASAPRAATGATRGATAHAPSPRRGAELARLAELEAGLSLLSPTDVVLREDAWEICAFSAEELEILAERGADRAVRARAAELLAEAEALLGPATGRLEPEKSTH